MELYNSTIYRRIPLFQMIPYSESKGWKFNGIWKWHILKYGIFIEKWEYSESITIDNNSIMWKKANSLEFCDF